jgi:type II secretory pathway pseudopilin PulG
MRWLKATCGLVVTGLAVAVLFGWLPIPQRADQRAAREAMKRQISDAEEARVAKAQAFKQAQISATQDTLRVIGRAYRRHLTVTKTPPVEKDFAELLPSWRSPRDDRPFEILWGVDLDKVPNPSSTLLAWEHSVDETFIRCALMVDGTTLVLNQGEFEKLPRAK